MKFHINNKILKLSILSNLIIFNLVEASFPFASTTINVKDLIQTVLTKGQEELCRESGAFRKLKGEGCKKDPAMARLSLVVCKGVKDFNKSGCYDKAITRLGYAGVENAKQDVIRDLSSNPIYNDFFCGVARSKFTGQLKEIADQCNTKGSTPVTTNPIH